MLFWLYNWHLSVYIMQFWEKKSFFFKVIVCLYYASINVYEFYLLKLNKNAKLSPSLGFRFFTPCVQVVLINTGWLQTLWSSVLDIIILPFFQSLAKCCSGISVVLTRDWETFAGIFWNDSNGNSHWTVGQMCGHLSPGACQGGPCPNAKRNECQLNAKYWEEEDIWKCMQFASVWKYF